LSFFFRLIYFYPHLAKPYRWASPVLGEGFAVFGEVKGSVISMRIGVLSDTHLARVTGSFRDIFEQFLLDVDAILHAGDFVSAEIVTFLKRKNFYGVYGNMDPIEVRKMLPGKTLVGLAGYRVGLIHGWGPSGGLEERIWAEFDRPDVIVYGHSHRAANHMRDGVLFFNPGTATGFTSSKVHSIGLLELDDGIHGEIVDIP
jgi:putative phosphoesterase